MEAAFGFMKLVINAACALVLVLGVLVGLIEFAKIQFKRTAGTTARWTDLRLCVGRYLLFALEMLIAADIIETMIRPTLTQLAILAGVSALRIVTGFALAKELDHLSRHASELA